MAEPKLYRALANDRRFRLFELSYQETNLLVGIGRPHWQSDLALRAGRFLAGLRANFDSYLAGHPVFLSSWEPLAARADAPALAVAMAAAARKAGVGPMAAVAGAFAAAVRDFLLGECAVAEVFVENGGDCALTVQADTVVAIQAAAGVESIHQGFVLPAGSWGCASSSGRLGHSRSLGSADVCTVVCRDAAAADALATAIANQVGCAADVQPLIEKYRSDPDICGLFVAAGGIAACCGSLPLCPLG